MEGIAEDTVLDLIHSTSNEEEPCQESFEDQLLRLQMEEIEQANMHFKGKEREGVTNDFQVALALFQSELRSLSECQSGQRVAQSMATALLEDNALLTALTDQEIMAGNDRDMAQRIQHSENGQGTLSVSLTSNNVVSRRLENSSDASKAENLRRLAIKQNYKRQDQLRLMDLSKVDHRIPTAESSTTAANRTPHMEERECSACREVFSFLDLACLPCEHEYCQECLTRLFAESMIDESLFPPRCCRKMIILEHVQMFMDPTVVVSFGKKKEELETANRTYCRIKSCSAFIPPRAIDNDVGTCTECGATTCCFCKDITHQGADCPQDLALNAVLAKASEVGWQRCYACARLVELIHGCNHITCRCGAEFCYECGARWHTCQCEQWSEDRLLGRARQIRERELAQAPQVEQQIRGLPAGIEPQRHQEDVELHRIMANLRENHACEHERWQYIAGRHSCEECAEELPQYIFECRQCQLRACLRCRRNRL